MFRRTVSAIMLTLLLMSMLTLASGRVDPSTTPIERDGKIQTVHQYYNQQSEIIIDQNQTWYGDFVVNATDTVIIKNSDFTVVDGDITVYGNLLIQNSTLRIHNNSFFKYLYLYGNLSLCESEIVGNVFLTVEGDLASNICVLSSTVPIIYSNYYVIVNASDSSIETLCCYAGDIYVSNSKVEQLVLEFLLPVFVNFSNSTIDWIELLDPDSVVLELQTGNIPNFSLHSSYGFSFALADSNVGKWFVEFGQNFLLTTCLLNSDIEEVVFSINGLHSPVDLVLKNGSIEDAHLFIENDINLTVENSTIHQWSINIAEQENPERDYIRISNSNFSAYVYCWGILDLTISNSTMEYLCATTERNYASGNLELMLTDSTVNTLDLKYSVGTIDLTLNEGYQEHAVFYSEQQSSNITVMRSVINHWGIETKGNATVRIHNSTLTGMHPNPLFAGLNVIRNSSVFIYDSNITGVRCGSWNPQLTIVNSTLNVLYVYDNSNVTIADSTVDTIISDPPPIRLTNSIVSLEIQLSLPLPSEYISVLISDRCDTPLPNDVKNISRYIQVISSYNDYFEAQVRIYYNETELDSLGTSERSLKMYYLDEENSRWLLCPNQGVNEENNFVWANVTHFSCFVAASSYSWKLDFIASTRHPIVDFAIYNGNLYAAADSMLYAFDRTNWDAIAAPTYVTSLESFEGKLIVGGRGGLYCYDGALCDVIFSVPTYIKVLGVYNNTLYAGTILDNPPRLYYCNGSADNPADWQEDTDFSAILNFSGPFGSIDSFAEYNGILYITSGGTIYSFNETDWNVANTFDDVYGFSSMKVYDSKLYLATRDQGWRKPLYQGGTGFSGRVIEFDGENWTTVLEQDYWIYSLEEYDGKLYAGTANKILTYNGTSWETSFNATEGAYTAISMITYDGKIYVGMGNGYIFADPAPPKAEHETIIVPEFPSLLVLPLFMTATLLGFIFYRRKHPTT
jgi:hypothetical protein